jgi:hypothetical protein
MPQTFSVKPFWNIGNWSLTQHCITEGMNLHVRKSYVHILCLVLTVRVYSSQNCLNIGIVNNYHFSYYNGRQEGGKCNAVYNMPIVGHRVLLYWTRQATEMIYCLLGWDIIHSIMHLLSITWYSITADLNIQPYPTDCQISSQNTWNDQRVSRLNTFLSNNKACDNSFLLINVVPFKVVSLWLCTTSLEIVPLLKAFHDVHSLKLGNCIPWFCLIMITSFMSFGHKKCHTAINLVSMGGVESLANVDMILLLPLTQKVVHKFGSNLTHVQISFKMLWTDPN